MSHTFIGWSDNMYRYQTKPIGVRIPFNPNEVQEMWLTFKQNDLIINRTKADLAAEISGTEDRGDGTYQFNFQFTQEESGDFSASAPIYAQVRWSESPGHSDVTNMYSFWLREVLMEGEI